MLCKSVGALSFVKVLIHSQNSFFLPPYQVRIKAPRTIVTNVRTNYRVKCNNEPDQMPKNMQNQNKDIAQAVQIVMSREGNPVEKFLIICLLRNGLRVSEICNVQNWQLIDKWTSAIESQKNGVKRIVNHYEAAGYVGPYVNQLAIQTLNRNRFYYYRQLKGLLPDYSTTRHKHRAVTHSARYIKAQTVFNATGDIDATKHAIGNKTTKATSRYLTDEQRRLVIKHGIQSTPNGQTKMISISKRGVLRLNIK